MLHNGNSHIEKGHNAMGRSMTMARNRWPWIITLLIAMAILGKGIHWGQQNSNSAKAHSPAPAVPVNIAKVQRQTIVHHSTGIGVVQPLHRVTIRPQVDGQLTGLFFAEGQYVRQGELLATLDDRALQASLLQAEAEKLRAAAQLKSAELDLARFQDLAKRQAVSRQQLEQQLTMVDQMRAAHRVAEANIEAEKVRLSHTRITSPISGRIGLRNVDVGNFLRASDSEGLFTVTQISPISVVFSLPQQLFPRLNALIQQHPPATVEAFERDSGPRLDQGRLMMIDNIIDSNTGTVRLRAEFDNAQTQLWPGQFVTVKLQTGTSPDSLTLPSKAVRLGFDSEFVYRVQGFQVKVVPVKRLQNENGLSIVEGLNADDSVVTDGFSRLKDGATIEIVANEADIAAGHLP